MNNMIVKKLMAVLMASAAMFARAATEVVDGITWTYTINYGEASVGVGWDSTAVPNSTTGDITIPTKLGECPVTSIGWGAFWGCSGLTSVDFAGAPPEGLPYARINEDAEIRYNAVYEDEWLQVIAECGFNNATAYDSLGKNPDGGPYAEVVGDVVWIYQVAGGDASVDEAEWYSLNKPSSTMSAITIPCALGGCPVTSIGGGAFAGCSGLTSVTIPEGVTSIEEDAFSYCSELTSVTIPSNVMEIAYWAFCGCSGLNRIYVSKGDSVRIKSMLFESQKYCIDEEKLDFSKITFIEGDMPGEDPEDDQEKEPEDDPEEDPDDDAIIIGAKVSIETEFAGYKATGLPKGLSLSSKGVISGTAKTAGEYTVTFTKKDAETVTKVFVVRKENEPTVECPVLAKGGFMVGVSGAEGGIPLEISAESGVKSVTAKNLPAGMKIVQDKATKEWSIQGGATKAGTFQVTLTVTTVAGAKVEEEFVVTVSALPDMAIGTFNGFVYIGSEDDALPYGTLQVTTTDAGKITAKVTTAAKTYSFSATCWDAVEGDDYSVKLSLKTGETLSLALASKAGWNERQLTGEMSVGGKGYAASAQRNAFGKTWYFDVEGDETDGWRFAYAANPKAAALTLSLGADGKTSISGKLGTLKVSASGFADVSGMSDGAIIADFAPVVTVNKAKMLLSIRANLWFDRSNDHDLIGSATLVK